MRSARARRLAIVSIALVAWPGAHLAVASAKEAPTLDKGVLVVLVPKVSFEQLLAIPEVRALSRAGGAALMSSRTPLTRLLASAFPHAQVYPIPSGSFDLRLTILEQGFGPAPGSFADLGRNIRRSVAQFTVRDLLVIVAAPSESQAMLAAKDELAPIVMATGSPEELFPQSGSMHTLASDTTRRVGVVSDEDVVPTIMDFVGHPILGNPRPHGLIGSPLRVVHAPPPFALHAKHLANRRMSVPIQIAAGIYVTLAGILGVAMLALRRGVPARLGRGAAWLGLTVPALATALLAAGHLPVLRYSTVVPFLVIVPLVVTLAFAPLARRDLLLAPAAIGAAVLVYFAVEAMVGWTAAQTPFLGGSELDGARFYGLPNAFIGLLMGCALYVAARLRPLAGSALIAAVGLFAGLPGMGANLGGAVAILAAAGLWLAIRTRGRLDTRGLALAAGVVILGTAGVLAAHVFLTASPTHVTRFEETGGRSLAGIWHTFTDRLAIGWRLILRNPFALIPVLGVPATLTVVLRPPRSVRRALELHPEWRDAILVILLGSIVAYFANDSGAAAIGEGFSTAVGGLLYVSLSEQTWKMERT